MKEFKTNTRYNSAKAEIEVNCEGFFNNDFFSFNDVLKRQDEVYSLFLKSSGETINECSVLYEALEHMRLALLKK